MASVPQSQYDDLQKRHENMRKSREREQRRCSKLEAENARLRNELQEVLGWARTERAPLREQEIASIERALRPNEPSSPAGAASCASPRGATS